MPPKAVRLTTRDIQGLSNGKSVFGTLVSMRYIPSEKTKFAVSVSKKSLPKAAHRNKLRRIIYKSVQSAYMTSDKPAFIMLMPKKECLDASEETLISEIQSLFKRSGVR